MNTKRLAMAAGVWLAAGTAQAADVVSLEGRWRFQLDRAQAGMAERWFARTLPDQVILPGSLPAQGIGDDVSVQTCVGLTPTPTPTTGWVPAAGYLPLVLR